MRKKTYKLFALMLAALVAFSGCGKTKGSEKETEENKESSEKQESEYPEYLNLDSAYPIIKDEHKGTIKLKVAIVQDSTGGKWEDLWLSKYLKDKYNLEFEVESIPSTALEDKKNIMLMSGELPDIMINMQFSTIELMKYGQTEGLFLKCDEYISETLTPSIVRNFEEVPGLAAASTCPDGHVYSLPHVYDVTWPGNWSKMFINTAWLEELGLEMPETLDEFVNVLYKAKESDVTGVGSENFYPLGGGMETYNASRWIMNALGYTGSSAYGFRADLRDGEVVIPVYDMEVFQEYLKLMNQFYNDGIINPNYFTIEGTEIVSQMVNSQNLVFVDPVFTIGMTNFEDWEVMYPLTSEYQEEPEVAMPNAAGVGGFVISAETEYPELCMRFADIYYNNQTDDAYALWVGPGYESEYNYGYVNEEFDPESGSFMWDEEKLNGVDLWTYLMSELAGFFPDFGCFDTNESVMAHFEDYEANVFDVTTEQGHYLQGISERVIPYGTLGFPSVYYLDQETSEKVANLETLMEPYIKEQVALFITGQRPLSETGDFIEELKDMGMEDLLTIYQQVYSDWEQNN